MSLRRGISRISEEWYRDLEGIGNRKSLALAEYEASLTEPPYRDICTSSNTMSSSVDRIIHCFLCQVLHGIYCLMENLYQIPIKTKTLISFVDRFIHCVKYAWYILIDGTFVSTRHSDLICRQNHCTCIM